MKPRYHFKHTTYAGTITRNRIIKTALKLALKNGINTISDAEISKKMKIERAGIYYYFPTQKLIIDEVIKLAIETETLGIIAQIVILDLPAANQLTKALKRKALLSFFK